MKTRVPLLGCLLCLAAFQLPLVAAPAPNEVSLVLDSGSGRASLHGWKALRDALESRGLSISDADTLDHAQANSIFVAGRTTSAGAAEQLRKRGGWPAPTQPESLLIRKTEWKGRRALLIEGADDRGLMYALLDVAGRIGWASAAEDPFVHIRDADEQPDVRERAVSIYTMQRAYFEQRLFDPNYWMAYFDMLARDRFNSFVLIFGYENGGYMAPAYPYFFDVPGFPEVRVTDFTSDDQQRYASALDRLIEMAHDRGLKFTVGLWDHVYRGGVQSGGVKGANPGQPVPGVVWGLNRTNLMTYSRAAFAEFLKRFPGVDAVQFRMHNESGLKPGAEMHEFWRNIYQVVRDVRPSLEFNARAKEFPDDLIDLALEMGIHIRICTKYWAEQMGLPFHPTHIPRQNQFDRRHGYADLLRYPKRYPFQWRLWNGGTTRILLWGDPEFARLFANSTHLYDGDGFEINEMLATKMEAQPHDQEPFELLQPQHRYFRWEFQRYWHFYQVFGREGYNPQTPDEVWDHEFQKRFGPDAGPILETGAPPGQLDSAPHHRVDFPLQPFPHHPRLGGKTTLGKPSRLCGGRRQRHGTIPQLRGRGQTPVARR